MRLWYAFVERVRALLFRAREERETERELAFHLAMQVEQNVRAGMTAAEARRRAQLELGGAEQIRDDVRRARGLVWLDHAVRDVRHGWRSATRAPVLALVVIVSLGVGIGVNTAIFSWLQALVLKPIPGVADARDYYLIEPRIDDAPAAGHAPPAGRAPVTMHASAQQPGTRVSVSWPEHLDLRERLTAFEDVIAFRTVPFAVGRAGDAQRAAGQLVSGNYFRALGLTPALGSFPAEAARSSDPVVVISYAYWQTHFGGARDVIGRTLHVNDRAVTIIGVTPRGFQGTVLGLDFAMWLPAELAPLLLAGSRELDERDFRGYSAAGRLRAGTSLAQAQSELDAAMTELAALYPESNAGVRADVLPFWRAPRGPQQFLVSALGILQGIMLLLLLAVCANTANLLLARATTRQHEVDVRRALGASRWRIVSLLLSESLVLALLGAALGGAIAYWGTNALRAGPMIAAFPIRYQTDVDGVGLGVAVLLGIVCGLGFGIAPALQLLRGSARGTLRIGAGAVTRSSLRSTLMGVEVGLALVVLVAAAIFVQGFGETRDTDPGFDRDGVLLAAYDLSGRNLDDAQLRTFAAELLAQVRALPGVEHAAIARMVPLDIHGMPVRTFTLEGRTRDVAAPDRSAINIVTPGYFAALGIPLVAGDDFADLNDANTAPQVIVNQAFVDQYLDGADPIGRRIGYDERTFTIAGVAATTLYNSFSEAPTPLIHYSYRDRPSVGGELHVRTRPGAEIALAPQIRRIARDIDPLLPIYDVRTIDEHIDKNLIFRRIPARMFAVLGPLLLVLAAMGIYAVVSFSVSRRAREIGLRLALGASTRDVVSQIVRESLRIIAIGAGTGWFVALLVYIHVAVGRPLDPMVFLGVPALLVAVATLAAWIPARRASRVDPMATLRAD